MERRKKWVIFPKGRTFKQEESSVLLKSLETKKRHDICEMFQWCNGNRS